MSQKWQHRIRLSAGDVELTHPEITMGGVVRFSESWDDDLTIITLQNLKDSVISQLAEAGTVTVEAGYRDDIGVVHQGVIRTIRTTETQGDRTVSILAGTGIRDLQDTRVSRTYRGQVRPRQVVEDLLDRVPAVEGGTIRFPREADYPSLALSTTVFRALLQVGRDWDRTVYLDNLTLHVEDEEHAPSDRLVYLNPGSGLVGVPKRIDPRFQIDGYTARSVLTHPIRTGARVELNHPSVEGTFRAVMGKHDLDEFQTTAKLREVA